MKAGPHKNCLSIDLTLTSLRNLIQKYRLKVNGYSLLSGIGEEPLVLVTMGWKEKRKLEAVTRGKEVGSLCFRLYGLRRKACTNREADGSGS